MGVPMADFSWCLTENNKNSCKTVILQLKSKVEKIEKKKTKSKSLFKYIVDDY